MFCHKCGIQLSEDVGFCHKCGTKIVSNDTDIDKTASAKDSTQNKSQ
jgi:uncharacterized membrane protein YvbJ